MSDPLMGRDDRAGTRPRDAGHVPFGVSLASSRSTPCLVVSAWLPASVGGGGPNTKDSSVALRDKK